MITLIRKKRDRGEYNSLSSLARFTKQLTLDLLSVYDDNHLIVEAGVNKEWECGEDLSREERERQLAERRFENFGFHRVERLPGNIGYLALKHLERATLVGESTSGGAHATQLRFFPDLNFTLHLPIGYAVNPVTGTNWEGKGVEPDVQAPAEEALQVAYVEALKAVLDKETDGEKKKRLEWILEGVEAEAWPRTLDHSFLTAYAGTYEGSIKVWIDKGILIIKRPDHDPYHAIPMGEDRFMLKDEEQRILFVRDGSGRVKEACVLFPDGRSMSMARVGG